MVTMEVRVPSRYRELPELLDMGHFCRGIDVVESGVDPGECFGPENLFLVQRAVRLPELCMPLGGKFAEAVITGQFAHSDVFSGRITLFLNTPSLSISSSTMSPGLSQGCTSGPSSRRDPVPTVPDPSTSPGWS